MEGMITMRKFDELMIIMNSSDIYICDTMINSPDSVNNILHAECHYNLHSHSLNYMIDQDSDNGEAWQWAVNGILKKEVLSEGREVGALYEVPILACSKTNAKHYSSAL